MLSGDDEYVKLFWICIVETNTLQSSFLDLELSQLTRGSPTGNNGKTCCGDKVKNNNMYYCSDG